MSGFSISPETVAIITRTRNRPLLLGRAMDSVLAQSWTGWHHYLVNDGGAPDAVEALAARRSDAYAGRLTLIHNPRSLGMEAASNVGIRRGREDFIVIHDDDDSWHPDFLAATVEFLRDTGDRFAGTITHTVRVWEEIAGDEVRELSRENDFNTYLRAVHLAAVARGNQFPPISFLFRRTALEAVGTYDEAFPVLGDWDFNLRFLARFDIGVVERPLAFWHNRGGSGEQASSVVGALKKHLEYDAALRNRLLRRALSGDAEASAIGLMANTETAVAAAVQREREISRLATLLEQENRRFESEKGHLASRFDLELGQVHALLGARDREIEQLHHRLAESLADKEYLKGHVTSFSGRVEVLTERVAALAEREAAATAREAAANAQAAGLMRESAELRTRIAALYGSWSWKLSLPVRLTGRLLRRLSRRTPPVLNQSDERTPTPPRDYAAWIALYDTPPPQALARLRERAAASGIPVAVCVPEGQPGCPALVSLETQIHAPARLLTVAEFDTLTEQWVVFLRPEDQLAPHALACLAAAAAETSAAVIYADEDCLDAEGRRHMPWFKPEPNPEGMLSQDLPGAFVAWRCARIAAAGGWIPHLGTAAAYDLSLRLWAEGALHLPHVLVHRRSPQPIPEHGAAAVLAHLRRHGLKGEGILSDGRWHIRHAAPEDRRITAIIPTRDRADMLRQCLDGLLNGTDWADLEVLIVDNGSREETTLALFREVATDPRVRVLPMDGPFNYAALNNAAARQATGAFLLLLNNDIEMVERGWLREMAGLAAQDDVGAVGAKLLYPDRTVQHAGVLIGRGGVAGHMFHRLPGDAPGAGGRAIHAQDLSAVTAACLLTRTAVWRSLNGLEEGLAVAFNDTDYCLRVRQAGLRVVWTPHATLIHHESVSRGADEKPENRERLAREARFMMDRWGNLLKDDPFFSPNLDMETADGTPAFPPRVPRPWEEG